MTAAEQNPLCKHTVSTAAPRAGHLYTIPDPAVDQRPVGEVELDELLDVDDEE